MNIERAVELLERLKKGLGNTESLKALDMAIYALNYDWTEFNDFINDKIDNYRTDPYPPVRYMVVDDLEEVKRYLADYRMDVVYEGAK